MVGSPRHTARMFLLPFAQAWLLSFGSLLNCCSFNRASCESCQPCKHASCGVDIQGGWVRGTGERSTDFGQGRT